jgi:hypothetical protein
MLPKESAKTAGARRYGYRYFAVVLSYLQTTCWESCHICHLSQFWLDIWHILTEHKEAKQMIGHAVYDDK